MENKMKLSEGLKKIYDGDRSGRCNLSFHGQYRREDASAPECEQLDCPKRLRIYSGNRHAFFCILTGGNIDLSVGSVVCFVGAVGGSMMITMGINPYLTLLAMLIIGMLVGAWQGFWIAYVRIPPFIVTLAGMLMFRGLSNVVLQGMTLSPIPDPFLNLFNTYVPDLFGMQGFNLTCFLVGIIACLVFVALELLNRRRKLQKGYRVDPIGGMAIKMTLISFVVLFVMYKLARYKGIPNA